MHTRRALHATVPAAIGMLLLWASLADAQAIQTFEAGQGDWSAENGLWEVGTPTAGPSACHTGTRCAGTVLSGNYPKTDSRFVSPSVRLPAGTPLDPVLLRFWHWFSWANYLTGPDRGTVQLSVYDPAVSAWGGWTSVSPTSTGSSGAWTLNVVDLTAFSGKLVRIGFYHQGTVSYGSSTAAGWYLDDIEIPGTVAPPASFTLLQDFELSQGDWAGDNGLWEVGTPTAGPTACHQGIRCAGTILAGNYPKTNSRLVSPAIRLPSGTLDNPVWLRFWQWFSWANYLTGPDRGVVQLSVYNPSLSAWSGWTSVGPIYTGSSAVWTQHLIDLTAYSDKLVRVGFYHQGTVSYGSSTSAGWYLDDIAVGVATPGYTVTPSAGPGGTINPATPQTVAPGATTAFTITPSAGYAIQSVTGCGGSRVGSTYTTGPITANCTVTATFVASSLPTMSVDKAAVYFAAVTTGSTFITQTSAQTIRLMQSKPGTVTWTASVDLPWATVSPASGVGPADLSVAVNPGGGVPVGATLGATLTLTFSGAATPSLPVTVILSTLPSGTSATPFGYVDTPAIDITGVEGAVPFTGWGLDDLEVESVVICREAVVFEAPGPDARCAGAAQIYVGTAVFIERARPDVETAYPMYPRSSRAGWGFMVLTNMLPDVGRRLATGGNGTFTFHVYARDRDGHVILLGSRTMTCDNEHGTLPFGAIDTPGQGALASGSSYVNFGWALTQNPKFIPVDGSTIQVYVDGVGVGNVSYNHYRPDIAEFFPGFANSNGAVGYRILDTTALANGVHTIAWTVADSAGSFTGIGSRFFWVSNDGGASTAAASFGTDITISAELAVRPADAGLVGEPVPTLLPPGARAAEAADLVPLRVGPVAVRRGWNPNGPVRELLPDRNGRVVVRSEELDRVELTLASGIGRTIGFMRVGSTLAPLPTGSSLDARTGVFTWAPGVGFVGTYDFVFVHRTDAGGGTRQDVRIVLAPKAVNRRIPRISIDRPLPQQEAGPGVSLAGWAADPRAETGPGIDLVHVWAYPVAGGAPIFLGLAQQGVARPDVAATLGEQFLDAGFRLEVQGLPPGSYDIAVSGRSAVSGAFLPAATVRVTVRP